ncbi:MAG: transporter substrate-binding domain-containing protein [Anaerolineae bacterium]|jgi:polar amino acid transport system substrate-binding protein|nr:transporter substrate-binding domain-containing protein [Anaerolineae bacterium]
MKKFSFVVLSMLILALMVASCGPKQENELVVGMELAYPPFETTDENGDPAGISVEMAYALGEYLDRPVRIENMAWSGLIPALTTGKIDIILSSMTITEERAKTVNFSDPYAKAQLSLLVNNDSPVESFDDLKEEGALLAVKNGSTGHLFALENLPEENIVVFDKETACVLEVEQGRADAFVYDALTVYRNAEDNENTHAVFTPFQEEYEYWGMALNQEDTELLAQVNAFLAQYQAEGKMNELADTYLGEIKSVFDAQGLPFFFDLD